MKIAYLSNSTIPSRAANSVQVMKMCEAFSAHGHRVLLVAQKGQDRQSNTRDVYALYGVEPIFRILRLPRLSIKGWSYIHGLLASLLARVWGAELAYGRHLASCFLSTKLGLPTAFEAHQPIDGDKTRNTRQVFERMVRQPRFQCLVVISQALKIHFATELGVPEQRMCVAPDGADPVLASRAPERLSKSDRLQVGYVGHLYAGKGMEIVAELASACPWADFHVVGGTESDIAGWRDRLGEPPNVLFHGFMPHGQVRRYQQGVDVVLAPYQRHVSAHGGEGDIGRWMSPLKIFEYMAVGKPILASDLPVLREVLDHEHNALLASPEDPKAWVEQLNRLREDVDLRERLGRTAKRELEAEYAWSIRAQRVLQGITQEGDSSEEQR